MSGVFFKAAPAETRLWYLQGRVTGRHPENQRGPSWAAPPSALGSLAASAEMADDANAVQPAHTWRQSYFRNLKHAHETHTNKNPPVSPATSHDRRQRRFNQGNVSVFGS